MTEPTKSVLKCRKVVRKFREGDSELVVLSGVDLDVRKGEVVARRLKIPNSACANGTTCCHCRVISSSSKVFTRWTSPPGLPITIRFVLTARADAPCAPKGVFGITLP